MYSFCKNKLACKMTCTLCVTLCNNFMKMKDYADVSPASYRCIGWGLVLALSLPGYCMTWCSILVGAALVTG